MTATITVLYGSETGDAHDIAETLTSALQRYRYDVRVSSLDEFDLKELLFTKVLIIVCSTTGQGEFPKNARKFWKFMLKKKLPNDLLNHLYFTTFGLGDSSYPKFNYAIKKLHNRMLQLGAVEFSKRAEADQQSTLGIDGYYVEFQKLLLKNLQIFFPLPEGVEPISEIELLPPKNKVVVDMKKPKKLTEQNIKSIACTRADAGLVRGTVNENVRITEESHFQDVRHFNVKCEDEITYSPGDTLSLYPTNDPEDVQQLIESQGWQEISDRRVIIEGTLPSIDGGYIKSPTLRSLITHHLDLRAIPRRSFFNLLKHFATDEREKEKLDEFSSYKNPEELYDYANRPRRSILEVVQEFFSVKIPIEYVFDLFPVIKPRLFSISSPPDSHSVDLTIAIVQYKTMIRRIRKGLCTNWIKTLSPSDEIVFKVNRNGMRFGVEKRVPIVMIAPGTGVAPMRSLIQDLVKNKGYNKEHLYLFFGCRFQDKDFLYDKEWTQLISEGKLNLVTAFSRQSGGYVQDQLYLRAPLIAELLTKKRAIIYVCGSTGKMPTQVRVTLETILQEQCNLSKEDSEKYLLELEVANRYLQETW